MLKAYIQLTKPGIIFGNLIAVFGGFFLASRDHYALWAFLWSMMGVALIIAGGCVANNLIDRDIDIVMQRTAKRATVTGLIGTKQGILFSSILMLLGLIILFYGVNKLAAFLGILGLFFYVGLYSLYFKRHSIYGTLIGSVSGAIPPVIGYVAVTHKFDLSALLILLMFSVWQMPHAYAIAMNRFSDYKQAKIPVLPHIKGVRRTKIECLVYCFLFLLLSITLGLIEQFRIVYTLTAFVTSSYWFYCAYQLFSIKSIDSAESSQSSPLSENELKASKKLFYVSIILISAISLAMAIPF